jgi:hypothetical protein
MQIEEKNLQEEFSLLLRMEEETNVQLLGNAFPTILTPA